MKKIEIRHLAPYLPFSLKCEVTDLKKKKIAEMHSIYSDGSCTFHDIVESEKGFTKIKPILKPLSGFGDSDDLRKVHEFIGLGKWCPAYDQYFDAWFNDPCSVDKLVLQCPYEILQYFFLNHYDVFGLIDKGLAVANK